MLAPDFLPRALDWLLKSAVGISMNGVSFGPQSFSDLDFADDVALLVELLELVVRALGTMASATISLGLEVNLQKTKKSELRAAGRMSH